MARRHTGDPLTRIGLKCVLAVALILPAAACATGSAERGNRGPKVALIGWDGATWDVIDPMLRQGRLPVLARLIASGGRGTLVGDPPLKSPALWTTLATGFPPSAHGVTGFLLPDPGAQGEVLASTFHRRRSPLWRMASASGKSVGFVGWWTTWPAEPVRGYIVSDHLAYSRCAWAPRPDRDGYHLSFPAGLADELAPFTVQPDELDVETLTTIVPFDATEQREMMAAQEPVVFHGPSAFRYGCLTDASNVSYARHLLEGRAQPDLFGIVLILADVAGHVFWHHYEPELYPHGPDGHLHEAIPNVYEQLDRWTGEIVDLLSPDTRVIVLSDHGMHASGVLPEPEKNPAGDHAREGIIVISGADAAGGLDLGVRSQVDLAPTVLALLDLPLARDMPGRAIEAVFPPERLARSQWIATYGDGRRQVPDEASSPSREAYEQRLRSLGYIE